MAEAWEIWNSILERAHREGLANLPPVCQTIFRANCYLCGIEIGGLSGLLYNLSPDSCSLQDDWSELRQTATALRQMGEQDTAIVLEQCAERLESTSVTETTSWQQRCESAFPNGELDQLESQLLANTGQAWSALEHFTQLHQDDCHPS
jgi:hypothetical protein